MLHTITLLILSYAKPELLKLCLDSIFRDMGYYNSNGLFSRIDVMVVDNRSRMTPKVLKLLARYDEERLLSKIIINKENVSFSRGINIGLKFVETEYVCLINDDIEFVDKDWLLTLMKYFNPEKVASVSPVSLQPDGKVYYSGVKRFDEHYTDRLDKTGKERWTPWNNMAVMLTSMEFFRKYGFLRMDGKYKFYHSDEFWGREVMRKSKLMHLVAPITVLHHNTEFLHRRR